MRKDRITAFVAAVVVLGVIAMGAPADAAPPSNRDCSREVSEWDYYRCMGGHWETNFAEVTDQCLEPDPRRCRTCAQPLPLAPCDGEEQDWVATSFVPSAYPFRVISVSYTLTNAPLNGGRCDATLAHAVEVFVAGTIPPATPTVLASFRVPADPSASVGDRRIELQLPMSYALQSGEQLYVSVQNAGDVQGCMPITEGGATCVVTCGDDGFADPGFWSNAPQAPYRWVELSAFGIFSKPIIGVFGY